MPTEATQTTETAAVADQGANSGPEQKRSKKKASKKRAKPAVKKAAKAANAAKKTAKPAKKEAKPRENSKKQVVLDLLTKKEGATMAEIARATGWQNHSIRGFISGNLIKKMDLPVSSLKNEKGERTYRIEK